MNFFRRLKYLIPAIRAKEEREMNDEIEALSAIAADEAAADAVNEEDIQYTSRRKLGNLTLVRENARAAWGWRWLEELHKDFCYAFRVLRKQPGFLVVAVGSLALGIGANTAIFRVVNQLLIRTLPVEDPDRLIVFESGNSFSYFAYNDFARHSHAALSQVFALYGQEREVDTGGVPQRANVELVTGNYFSALGVSAQYRRTILPTDDTVTRPAYAAAISHAFWTRQFADDPRVIGREVRVQGVRFTIVGVVPAEFFGVVAGDAVDVWIPLSTFSSVFPGRNWPNQLGTNFLTVMGRLRSGVSIKQAEAILTPLYVQIDLERFPTPSTEERKSTLAQQLHLDPAAKGISYLRARFSKPLRIVFAMVALVLLLACVNLMNLQLARSRERRKELAVRLAIGAGGPRLIRQQFTESLVVRRWEVSPDFCLRNRQSRAWLRLPG
jgi:predicted permease